ncbi:IclR family transcriptional regulator [Microbacterium aoyamense]|uniref:IclR family transcriptional regulator n=1 Tax=Microbacterium aoyamense TaxID=344166 RepID=A0ABP5B4V4_9MICO|nr:IclR family transcriptional regulator [Microbacterium aoyamense]
MDLAHSEAVDEGLSPRREGHITALQNGLAVLDMFDVDRPIITVAEIARHLGTHKSTASRIAATLVTSGFLRPATVGTGFQLTGKMTRLASIAAADTNLTTVAAPFLRQLVDELGETCHLGVLEGKEAVTVALMDGSFSVRMHSFVGKRSPAHCTAMGKVLLSQLQPSTLDMLYPTEQLTGGSTTHSVQSKRQLLDQLNVIRLHGYAIDDEELEIGLRCVAAPIRDHEDRVVASITIAGSSSRIAMARIDEYAARVIEQADRISRELGAHDRSDS